MDQAMDTCIFLVVGGSCTYTRAMLTTKGHPFCMPHITRWFKDKRQRFCPMCRSLVPEEKAHFKRDGTYALGWPRSFW